MIDDDLHGCIEKTSMVAEHLFKPDGLAMAYIHAEYPDGKNTLIACPMGPEDEVAFRVGFPRKLRRDGYRRWCFFCEAYSVEKEHDGVLPVNDPRRIEVIIFHAEDRAGGKLSAKRQIYRFPGQPPKLLPLLYPTLPVNFVMDPEGRPVA